MESKGFAKHTRNPVEGAKLMQGLLMFQNVSHPGCLPPPRRDFLSGSLQGILK